MNQTTYFCGGFRISKVQVIRKRLIEVQVSKIVLYSITVPITSDSKVIPDTLQRPYFNKPYQLHVNQYYEILKGNKLLIINVTFVRTLAFASF